MIEVIYWERRNSDYALQPEPGGILDQDERLLRQLSAYHSEYERHMRILDNKTKKEKETTAEPGFKDLVRQMSASSIEDE